LLCYLRELNNHFKNSQPWVKLGFHLASQKLYYSRCKWYRVHVCTIHQNAILMLKACNIFKLTRTSEHSLSMHQQCLSTMICNPPQKNYFSVTVLRVQDLPIYKYIRKCIHQQCNWKHNLQTGDSDRCE
jgi:hypothetical protein